MYHTSRALTLAAAAGLAMTAGARAQVVTDGGFESGAFAPAWTQFGDLGYTSVATAPVHGGTYAGKFGPTLAGGGGIQQTLTLNAGQQVLVTFWYQAQGAQNSFSADFGGLNLITLTNDTAHTAWTEFSFLVTVPSNNPTLTFTFSNPPSYDYIDDIQVLTSGFVTGACCTESGCVITTPASCSSQNGTFRGENSVCATANCPPPISFSEASDAGDLPGSAAVISGSGTPLLRINGSIGSAGDGEMYKFQVCDAANFSASTVGGTGLDTILSLYKSDGTGVVWNDDEVGGGTLQSKLTNQFVTTNGDYYLHISQWNKICYGAGGDIWINDGTTVPYRTERAPDGPGAPGPITGWNASTGTGTGAYTITLTGSCFLGGATGCYANCDGSTNNPLLTANDFQCFLNLYAAGNTIANCDQSTGNPLLTANDFQCFLNKYAVGCT